MHSAFKLHSKPSPEFQRGLARISKLNCQKFFGKIHSTLIIDLVVKHLGFPLSILAESHATPGWLWLFNHQESVLSSLT